MALTLEKRNLDMCRGRAQAVCCRDLALQRSPLTWGIPSAADAAAALAALTGEGDGGEPPRTRTPRRGGAAHPEEQQHRAEASEWLRGPASEDPMETQGPSATLKTKGLE